MNRRVVMRNERFHRVRPHEPVPAGTVRYWLCQYLPIYIGQMRATASVLSRELWRFNPCIYKDLYVSRKEDSGTGAPTTGSRTDIVPRRHAGVD